MKEKITPLLSTKDYFNQYLPVELTLLVQFVLENKLNQDLLNISSNVFYQAKLTSDNTYRIGVRKDSNWDILPLEWRNYFDSIKLKEERDKLLNDLANLNVNLNTPPTLAQYLKSCQDLSLERTCSNIPLLSYPPTSAPRTTPLPLSIPTWHNIPLTVRGKKGKDEVEGMTPKKGHECTRFSQLLNLKDEKEDSTAQGREGRKSLNPTHVIDVGAGCVRSFSLSLSLFFCWTAPFLRFFAPSPSHFNLSGSSISFPCFSTS